MELPSKLPSKLTGKHYLKLGKPYFLSKLEKAVFFKCTIQLSHFGFPIGKEDLRHIMNNYLNSSGRKLSLSWALFNQVIFAKAPRANK